MKLSKKQQKRLQPVLDSIVAKIEVEPEEAELIVTKAISGGEIHNALSPEQWLEQRFLPNCVKIDLQGYSKMCIDALKILKTTAATDYGATRQRDLGQLWADMTRGYLGEYAFLLYLKTRYQVESELGHQQGQIDDYLPMDIHQVKTPMDTSFRPPQIKIGIKATKWNGIWCDIPGSQFGHSDVHVFVKVGTGRDHLFAFFKHLSVFKDKVLAEGQRVSSLTASEADEIYDNLPTMREIPAYICGFILKSGTYQPYAYAGKKGRMHYKITEWNGPRSPDDFATIRRQQNLATGAKIGFEGIDKFSHEDGYLFNAGNLFWKPEDWRRVINML